MSTSSGMAVRLPDANGLSKVIGSLLGASTIVTKAQTPLLFTAANRRGYAALYVTAEGFCSAAVACDVKLAASAGGAIVEHPREVVDEWVRAGKLDAEGVDNLREVLNVIATNFNDSNPERPIKLWGCIEPGSPIPQRTLPLFARGVLRSDFDVEVDGYTKGKLAVFSAP